MGMDIEKLATSAIEDLISKTDYITPYVNSADKELCWDGVLYTQWQCLNCNWLFVEY